jgi:hypothetical protein
MNEDGYAIFKCENPLCGKLHIVQVGTKVEGCSRCKREFSQRWRNIKHVFENPMIARDAIQLMSYKEMDK